MRYRVLAGCVVWLCSVHASAQAPIPVVERVFTERGVATRVSLFSNRVVVLSISENGVQGFVQQLTLPADQYLVYLGILQTAADELGEKPVNSDVSTSGSEVVLTLHVGHEVPREIRFSPMATTSLPLSHITGAINDLESLVRAESPSAEELRTWEPLRGDRLELMTGAFALVVEVLDEGVVVLEYEDTYIREFVTPEQRDTVIRRVVERKR